MMPKPPPKVKMRIEFTESRLLYTVSMPITRAQRLKAADHLRHIADDLEQVWRRTRLARAIAANHANAGGRTRGRA
jgi:hypothetical protein